MKRLYLARHAKSSWDHPELGDFDRPLNSRGMRDAPAMGAYLAKQGHVPQHIVTSPAQRARTTAMLLAETLGIAPSRVTDDRRIYVASPSALLALIHEWDKAWDHVMIVGHNPGIAELALLLSGGGVGHVRTCAVLGLLVDADSWADVAPGCGQLCLEIGPKKICRA